MGNTNPDKLRNWVLLGVSVLTLGGFFQSVAVLPYKQSITEAAVLKLQTDTKADREILIRIEERLKALQDKLERPR